MLNLPAPRRIKIHAVPHLEGLAIYSHHSEHARLSAQVLSVVPVLAGEDNGFQTIADRFHDCFSLLVLSHSCGCRSQEEVEAGLTLDRERGGKVAGAVSHAKSETERHTMHPPSEGLRDDYQGASISDDRVIEVWHPKCSDSPDPVARLLIQRSEQQVGQDRQLTLTVRRIGEHPLFGINQFSWSACYSPGSKGEPERIKLTDGECSPGGDIILRMIDLLGHRVGTYLMAKTVAWAKHWPTAEVMQIKLSWEDEKEGCWGGGNKERRDRFYEQFGIAFIPGTPGNSITAKSKPMLAGELVTEHAKQAWRSNIRESSVVDAIAEQQREIATLAQECQRLEREAMRLREACQNTARRPVRQVLSRMAASPYAWGMVIVGAVALSLSKAVG